MDCITRGALFCLHYSDVITSTMASRLFAQLFAQQRKHQSSASLAFVRGIHRWPVDSPHKGPVTQMFPFDDVIMHTLDLSLLSAWIWPSYPYSSGFRRWHYIDVKSNLKRNCRFDEIVTTGCTGSCHSDNFQCSQWWQFRQNNMSVYSS